MLTKCLHSNKLEHIEIYKFFNYNNLRKCYSNIMFSKIIFIERRKSIMNLEVIIHITAIILGALSSGIPILIKWNKVRKAKNSAVTEAEKKQAHIEMLEQANAFIANAETAFKAVDDIMKTKNGSAGPLKKKSVVTDLQAFALSKGYEFDSEFWSSKVDEIVSFTKSVNGKNDSIFVKHV